MPKPQLLNRDGPSDLPFPFPSNYVSRVAGTLEQYLLKRPSGQCVEPRSAAIITSAQSDYSCVLNRCSLVEEVSIDVAIHLNEYLT